MKKVFYLLSVAIVATVWAACSEAKMDPAAVQARVDSLAAEKIEAANISAVQDCETRMATEVKPMADSLLSAAKAASGVQ